MKCAVALGCSVLICGAAVAAESGGVPSESKAPPSVGDEIIVLGRNWAEIRAQIRSAEETVYDRFNEINSNDEFDIHCYLEASTGSRILHRVCESNFWRDALAKFGEETARAMQGSPGIPPVVFLAEARSKMALLTDEMKRLAAQDEELRRDLWRLGNLEQGYNDLQRSGLHRWATTSAQQTVAQGTLPYGAALAADVRIGRRAWTHTLTQRTFTFAHVYGEIDSVAVGCRGQQEQLQYAAGTEWTLPADWQGCELRVAAPRGTTFTLFEFESSSP